VQEVWTYPGTSTERLQLEAFADAIQNGSVYPVPLEDIVNGIEVFEGVSASLKSGGWITL